jgi:hypothetical protein
MFINKRMFSSSIITIDYRPVKINEADMNITTHPETPFYEIGATNYLAS